MAELETLKTSLIFALIVVPLLPVSYGIIQSYSVAMLSIKIDDKTVETRGNISSAEPLVVELPDNDALLLTMTIHLKVPEIKDLTSTKERVKVSSELNELIIVADKAKTVSNSAREAIFYPQQESMIIYVYGNIPQMDTLIALLKVSSDTQDILNVIGKKTPPNEQPSGEGSLIKQETKSQPLLEKLDTVISNSTLPNKDYYVLKMQHVKDLFEEGKTDEASQLALQLIDEVEHSKSKMQVDQRDCEKARLKILEAEDGMAKSNVPIERMNEARQHLEYAKKSLANSLCPDAYDYAQRAITITEPKPIEDFLSNNPWVIPGVIVSGIGMIGFFIFRRFRGETFVGGLG